MAQIEVIQVGNFATNCYLVISETSPACVVIDPGGQSALIIEYLDERKLKPERIIATHAHADHTGAVSPLVDRYACGFAIGEADVQAAANQSEWLTSMLGDFVDPPTPTIHLSGGDSVEFDDVQIDVLATPGHTPGSISLHIDGHVFTGDTLFRESIGRFDLPGGNGEQEIESIRNVLLALDDSTAVLPGHGPSTSIGHERTANPYL